MRTEGLQDPCKRGNNCVNCFNLQQCFPVCACKTYLLWQQNISEKVKKHFLFSIPKKVSATNFSSLCKRGNVVAETMFPQQCFFICRGPLPPCPLMGCDSVVWCFGYMVTLPVVCLISVISFCLVLFSAWYPKFICISIIHKKNRKGHEA